MSWGGWGWVSGLDLLVSTLVMPGALTQEQWGGWPFSPTSCLGRSTHTASILGPENRIFLFDFCLYLSFLIRIWPFLTCCFLMLPVLLIALSQYYSVTFTTLSADSPYFVYQNIIVLWLWILFRIWWLLIFFRTGDWRSPFSFLALSQFSPVHVSYYTEYWLVMFCFNRKVILCVVISSSCKNNEDE